MTMRWLPAVDGTHGDPCRRVRVHRLQPMTFGHHGLRSAHTKIEPAAPRLIPAGQPARRGVPVHKAALHGDSRADLEDAGITVQGAGEGQRGRVGPERHQLMVFGCLDVIESVQAAGRGCY